MKIWELSRFSTFKLEEISRDVYRYCGMDGMYAKVTLLGYSAEGIFPMLPIGDVIPCDVRGETVKIVNTLLG